jgi:hypothetical protein
MALAGRVRAERHFALERMAEDYRSAYHHASGGVRSEF